MKKRAFILLIGCIPSIVRMCYIATLFKEVDDDLCKLFNKEKNFKKDRPDENHLIVLTEVFDGSLGNVITTRFGDFIAYKKTYIPSPEFTTLIWTIIKALQFLHSKKFYHGNFSMWSTLFVYDGPEKDQVIVKLANFVEKKNVSLEQAQREDWIDFRKFLDGINSLCRSEMITNHLDDVIRFFACIDGNRIAKMDEYLLRMEFFKTPEDRRRCASKLYGWCECELNERFLRSEHGDLVPMPWNKFKTFCGTHVLETMNNYKDRHGKKGDSSKYNTNDVVDLLKFVSGVYAHYNSLGVPELHPGLENADAFICEEFPYLFYRLREIENRLEENRIRQKEIDKMNRLESERQQRVQDIGSSSRGRGETSGGSGSRSDGWMGGGRSRSSRDRQGRGRSEGRGREHGGGTGGGRSRSAEPGSSSGHGRR